MRWWLFLFLLLLPAAHAVEEWHYAGDSFKIGTDLYSVEGSDYTRVLFSVNGRSYVIQLGECVKEGLSEYCYLKSAYPGDSKHIKYAAGNQYYGYYLGISAIQPKVTVTRTPTTLAPQAGESFDVAVTIKNEGDYSVTYLSYNETIPSGLRPGNGPIERGQVHYTLKTLGAGEQTSFKYTLTPIDYVNAQLMPNVTFTCEGGHFSAKVAPINLAVTTPLSVNHTMPGTVNLGDLATYRVNITNKGDDQMTGTLTVMLPEQWHTTDLQGFTEGANNTYTAKLDIKKGSSAAVALTAYSSAAGSYKIPVKLTASIHGTTFDRYYDEAVAVKADKLVPTVKLSGSRQTYGSGEQLTISGILENVNTGVTFHAVNGRLSAPGIFADIPFSHQDFPPKRTLTEAETVATMPEVTNTTVFNITLVGTYKTPTGGIYDFEAKRTITVVPLATTIGITRTVEPASPRPGENVTITVVGKNVYGKYATFSAYDAADLNSVSGLMFIETSMERDETKTLYIYQLAVPKNYDKATFNITTTVKLKDEPVPTKVVTVVPINGRVAVAQNVTNTTKQDTTETAAPAPEKKKLGFFASMWDFFKSLF